MYIFLWSFKVIFVYNGDISCKIQIHIFYPFVYIVNECFPEFCNCSLFLYKESIDTDNIRYIAGFYYNFYYILSDFLGD